MCLVLFVMALTLVHTSSIRALPESLSGSLRVDINDGEVDGEDRSALNQRYGLNWSRQLFPYLAARATFNYDRIGTTRGDADEVWREQLRPVVEFLWSHPDYLADAILSRLQSNSVDRTTSLVRETLSLRLSTRRVDRPIITLQYDANNTYNRFNRADRDSREDRYEITSSYATGVHQLNYNFVLRDYALRSSNASTEDYSHLLSWEQTSHPLGEKLRLATGYRFSHRREVTKFRGGATEFWIIPVVAALYTEDATPELSTLDPVAALADGNIADPTSPVIDIGEQFLNQNFGVDLGFAQDVRGLYVYTDRPSGSGVTWSVYLSQDNINWEPLNAQVTSAYSTSFSRYEIMFPLTSTRYVKAVSGGLNDIVSVLVTEVQAVGEQLTETRETRSQVSHQGSATVNYTFSDRLQSTSNVLVRAEPAGDFTNSRDQVFYGTTLRHEPWAIVKQSVSLQGGQDHFSTSGEEQSNTSVTYAVTVSPLKTLDVSLSLADRRSYINEVLDVESQSALIRSRMNLLPRVTVISEVSFSQTDQPVIVQSRDTWTYQTGLDLGLRRSLSTHIGYLLQQSYEVTGDEDRKRQRVTGSATWRFTRSVQLRGSVSYSDDEGRISTIQEYNATWRLGPNMSVSGFTNILESVTGETARRTSLLYEVRLNRRTAVNVNYTETSSSVTGNINSKTLQLGVRSSF